MKYRLKQYSWKKNDQNKNDERFKISMLKINLELDGVVANVQTSDRYVGSYN